MERYELFETEEERELKREQKINYYLSMQHLHWSKSHIEYMLDQTSTTLLDSKFGLKNAFPTLTTEEEQTVDEDFEKRKALIFSYQLIASKLIPLLDKEDELWEDIKALNAEICRIEGHRLSSESNEIYEPDGYGDFESLGYTRTCLVCGKRVFADELTDKDVVVKGKSDIPPRVLTMQRTKKNKNNEK